MSDLITPLNGEPVHQLISNSPEKAPFNFSNIHFACQVNARKAYVVPSTKNYLNVNGYKMQIRYLKYDTGCTHSLFYFQSVTQLDEFLTHMGPYATFDVEFANSPGGRVCVLCLIRRAGKHSFCIANDIFPNSSPFLQGGSDDWWFHLCTEDLKYIMEHDTLFANDATIMSKIRENLETQEKIEAIAPKFGNIPRRAWALLGSDLHASISILKGRDVYFFCDRSNMKIFGLEKDLTWKDLGILENEFVKMKYMQIGKLDAEELHEITDEFFRDLEFPDYQKFK